MALYWHVTSRENAAAILEEGFLGGWGDDGFGVYLFSDLAAAEDYAGAGGWDGTLADIAIIEIDDEDPGIRPVEVDPAWPNPEDYEFVRIFPMEDDPGFDEFWIPERRLLEDAAPAP